MDTLPPPNPPAGGRAPPPPPPRPGAAPAPAPAPVTLAAAAAAPELGSTPARRRRRWPVALAVVLLALVAGGAVAGVVWLGHDDAATVVQVRGFGGLDALPHGLRTEPRARWTFQGQGTPRFATAVDGDVFIVAESDTGLDVMRLAGADGAVTWRTETELGTVTSLDVTGKLVLAAVVRDGVVAMEAFDIATGASAWHYEHAGGDLAATLVRDGALAVGIVGDDSGAASVVVLGADGHEIWQRPIEGVELEGSEALVQEGGNMSLVELATGQERWTREVPEAAQVGLAEGRVFLAERRQVTAFDVVGNQVWRQALPADDPVSVVGQGTGLVMVVRGSSVVALSAADGHQRWEAPPAGVVSDTAPTTLTIRSTDDDVTLRVVDGQTGATRATRVLGPPSGVALAADVVYVGDGRGVTAYDRVSLAPLWSAVVAEDGDGRVISAVDDGVLVRDGAGTLIVLH